MESNFVSKDDFRLTDLHTPITDISNNKQFLMRKLFAYRSKWVKFTIEGTRSRFQTNCLVVFRFKPSTPSGPAAVESSV